MNFDFYSDRSDALNVLEFVFNEMNLVLFDLYSDYGQEAERYESLIEAERRLSTDKHLLYSHFQLWSPRHGGTPKFERSELDPSKCAGHTFRYQTLGFGMIQLYFSYPRKAGLSPSHIGHFEERGAYSRAGLENQNEVAQWNWAEIRRASRKLKYNIQKKLAVAKVSDIDTRDILPGALKQFETGVKRLHL